ncbi:creatininase family protein [Streptomyces sp. NPDC059477]|uniref:creatininase family protein n=1 Tax=Streptomyces sp. NPDC059477 TaxID=3346847 RepID=UPI0036B5CB99
MTRRTRAPASLLYGDLTSAEVESALRGATLVWPVGSLEQHGPHLPLSVDLDIPEALARQVGAESGGFVMPVQAIAARSLPQSGGGSHWPGTLHLRGTTLIDSLSDVLASLAPLRPGKLVVINGHYENEALLFEAIDGCRPAVAFPETEIMAFSWWSMVRDGWIADHLPGFPGWHAEHAGLTETSLMLYLRPGTVRPERPEHKTPPPAGIYRHPLDATRMSTRGVLSSTTGAGAALGELLFWHIIDNILESMG